MSKQVFSGKDIIQQAPNTERIHCRNDLVVVDDGIVENKDRVLIGSINELLLFFQRVIGLRLLLESRNGCIEAFVDDIGIARAPTHNGEWFICWMSCRDVIKEEVEWGLCDGDGINGCNGINWTRCCGGSCGDHRFIGVR